MKSKIAGALTSITSNCLGKKPELTVVYIQDNVRSWYIKGKQCEDDVISYDLVIHITAATNSDEEKESWLKAVDSLLKNELDISESTPNYISILDIDGRSWGFNGISQYSRLNKE